MIPDLAIEERSARLGKVEYVGVGDLELAEGELVAVAVTQTGAGKRGQRAVSLPPRRK